MFSGMDILFSLPPSVNILRIPNRSLYYTNLRGSQLCSSCACIQMKEMSLATVLAYSLVYFKSDKMFDVSFALVLL